MDSAVADVGSAVVRKVVMAALLAVCALALQACSSDITAQQQRDKKAELQRVADEHPDPNRQVRPQ